MSKLHSIKTLDEKTVYVNLDHFAYVESEESGTCKIFLDSGRHFSANTSEISTEFIEDLGNKIALASNKRYRYLINLDYVEYICSNQEASNYGFVGMSDGTEILVYKSCIKSIIKAIEEN